MNTALYVLAVLAALIILYFALRPVVAPYIRFRGKRLVTCPETGKPAAVELDAKHATIHKLRGKMEFRLNECSRWPEDQDCGQPCVLQIKLAPDDCLVRRVLTRWYQDKACAVCGRELDTFDWLEHRPALMNEKRETVEWNEIPPEKIPETLSTHFPICWNCHVAETFRRRYPELVVDRSVRDRTAGNGH